MKLADLQPVFLCSGGSGVTTADGQPIARVEGVGLCCNCPCGNDDEEHRLYVPFANPIGEGKPPHERGWQRRGDSFETLSLTPSIQRMEGCRWHGYITDGNVLTF